MILSFLKVPPQPHAVLTTAEVAKWLQISERSVRSEEHTSELQSQSNLVCRLLLEKKTIDWSRTSARNARPPYRTLPTMDHILRSSPSDPPTSNPPATTHILGLAAASKQFCGPLRH